MIVEFQITNFKSYKDNVSLSFMACDNENPSNHVSRVKLKDGTILRLLNSIVILGTNASGKSNILWGLKALLFMIINSRSFDVRYRIPFYLPFAFDEMSKDNPTEMMLDFVAEGERYVYTIKYTATEILFEELKKVVSGNYIQIFQVNREQNNKKELTIGEGFQDAKLELSYAKLLPNQLLLSVLGTREANGLQGVYGALSDMYIRTVNGIIDIDGTNISIADEILKDMNSNVFKQLARMIHIADIGIDDIYMIRHGTEEFSFPAGVFDHVKKVFIDQNKWEILMKHGGYNLDLRYESTGTKNLFAIGALVLNTLDKGTVLILDEMNLAMHPAMFRFIVSLFHNPEINKNNAQLLFSTHDAFIANDNCMRADQVWFAEKDEKGVSQLFSLQDFENIPIITDFGNWYMAGRFGALPKFGDVKNILHGKS